MPRQPDDPLELPPDAPETQALPAGLDAPSPPATPTSTPEGSLSDWTVEELFERWRVRADELSPRYREGRLLGRGGMGVVKLAWDRRLRRDVAVKTMKAAGSDALARFLTEAQVTGQLAHPNIPPIHDLGLGPDGLPFFTMRALPGKPLSKVLRSQPPLGVGAALAIFGKLCDAVDYAHDHGVIHRDLKPANIILGDFGEVYVIDWGLAKSIDPDGPVSTDTEESGEELTRKGLVIGTPGYMSPEQAAGLGELDARSDVYSLGAILYALLTGRSPFDGSAPAKLLAVHRGDVPRPRRVRREIPWEIEQVVLKAMALRAEDRYATVAALKSDLAAFQDGRRLPGIRYGAARSLGRALSRHRRALVTGTLVVVGAALASVVVLTIYAVSLSIARDRAVAAERTAEARSLDLQVALARVRAESGLPGLARQDLLEAAERARALGADPRPSELAASLLDARYPPPSVRVTLPRGARAVLDPDADRVWVLSDGELLAHDLITGALRSRSRVPDGASLSGFTGGSPRLLVRDGARLDRVDVHTGAVAWTLRLPPEAADATSLTVSRDDRVLAWSSGWRTGFLSVPDGAPLGPVQDASLSHLSADGSRALVYVAEGGPHRQVERRDVIDVGTGAPLGGFASIGNAVYSDDLSIALVAGGESAEAWTLDGRRLWSAGPRLPGLRLDGSRAFLLGADGLFEIRDLETGALHLRRGLGLGPTTGGTAPQVSRSWVAAPVGGALHLWSLASQPLSVPAHEGVGLAVDVSPDGQLLATAGWEGDVALWDWRSGVELWRVRVSDAGVRDVAFSPDGARLATADRDGQVRLVDVATGALDPRPFDADRGIAMAARWVGPERLAAAYEDGHLLQIDVEARVASRDLQQDLRTSWTLAARGDRIAVSGRDGKDPLGEVWSLAGERLASIGTGVAYGAALSADGTTAAFGSSAGEVVTWSESDGQRSWTLSPPEAVMSLAIDDDGELLAAGTFGGSIALFDLETGQELGVVTHATGAQSLRFAPGSQVLLAVGGQPGAWSAIDLGLTRRTQAAVLELEPGASAAADGAAAGAELSWDWPRAVQALEAAGDSGLRLARARRAAGDVDGALAVLPYSESGALRSTLAAWRAALATPGPDEDATMSE